MESAAAPHLLDEPLSGERYAVGRGLPALDMAAWLLEQLGGAVVRTASAGEADLGLGGARELALSAYGGRGRFAGAPVHDAAVEAIGGAAWSQWSYGRRPAYMVTRFATVGQALLAAIALLSRRLGGGLSELSTLQSLFALQSGFYCYGPVQEEQRWLHSPRGQQPSYSTYLARDGWVFFGASTFSFTLKLFRALGIDDVLSDPRIHGSTNLRSITGTDLAGELWERIGAVVRERPRDEWLQIMADAKVPAGPVLSLEEALAHPQPLAAGLIEPAEPVARLRRPVQVERTADSAPRAASGEAALPLARLRVLELAGYIAGPYCGRLLADLGADVVKVEPPDGDPFRVLGYGFIAWNYGKRSVALDLSRPDGREALLRLAARADIVVTNYKPEALARLGVGRETMQKLNPALIHCTISAYGERGPMAHLPGFDPIVQGFAGVMTRQGGSGEPVKSQIAATDYLSAMLGAAGILAALQAQRQRGGGYTVHTSLLAAALLLNADAYEDLRNGKRYRTGGRDYDGPAPFDRLYPVQDGWLLTAEPERGDTPLPAEAQRLLTAGMTLNATIAALAKAGVTAVPCLDPRTLPAEPHNVENGLFMTVVQPELGAVTLAAPLLGPGRGPASAPATGAANAEIDGIWQM